MKLFGVLTHCKLRWGFSKKNLVAGDPTKAPVIAKTNALVDYLIILAPILIQGLLSPEATIWVINPSYQNCFSYQDYSRPLYIIISYIILSWSMFQLLLASLLASQLLVKGMARRNNKAGKQVKYKPKPRPRAKLKEINIYEIPKQEEILNKLST